MPPFGRFGFKLQQCRKCGKPVEWQDARAITVRWGDKEQWDGFEHIYDCLAGHHDETAA